MTDTFESLILEAKKYGRGWKRYSRNVDGDPPFVVCVDNRCVLGAVIFGRGIPEPDSDPFDEDSICLVNTIEQPDEDDAVLLLKIPAELAKRVINANDGNNEEDAKLLDKLLGIGP